MRKLFTLLSCLIWVSTLSMNAFGQQQVIRCYTVENEADRRTTNPDLETKSEFESWMADELVQYQQQQATLSMMGVVKTLPTVVHVIYSNASENIPDNQVISQIDILNDDYRRTNADAVNTPAAFLPDAVDTEIEFCLAQTDPNGALTTGINRVSLAGSPFSTTDVDNNIKPTTIWNPDDYLNIWVVNMQGGILGYAQFPNSSGLGGLGANNGNANTDGVVLLTSSVGANTNPGPYNLGRTATHEVGHWLGLRHIWGDDVCGADDFCADTPDSDASNFGCPTGHVSCTTTDMIENYMDYTDDACMNLFTADQKARMDVVMNLSPRRASLLLSNKCQAPNSPPVADFSADADSICPGGMVNFTAQAPGATSWNWSFPGGTPASSTTQNPSVTYNSAGVYNVTLTATNSFGSDVNTQNGFIYVGNGGTQVLFSDDFSGGIASWTLNDATGGGDWEYDNVGPDIAGPNGLALVSTTAANGWIFFDSDGYAADGIAEDATITSPAINCMSVSSVNLQFESQYCMYLVSTTSVEVSNDGVSWTSYPVTDNDVLLQDECSANPTLVSLDISSVAVAQPTVYVRFRYTGDWDYWWQIDDVLVTGICDVLSPPFASFTSDVDTICPGGTVNFTDQSGNVPQSWNWTFPGGTPASSTAQNPSVTYNTAGTYDVTLSVSNPSGTDVTTQTALVHVGAGGTEVIFSEDFGTGIANWTINDATGGGDWQYGTAGPVNAGGNAGALISTTTANGSIYFDSDGAGDDAIAEDATITSPPFNCVGLSNISLQFESHFCQFAASTTTVEVSNDGGATWSVYQVPANQAVGGNACGNNPEYITMDISADAFNEAAVLIRFHYTGNYDWYWQIDDILVTGVCSPPSLPVAGFSSDVNTICLGESVTFTDETSGLAQSWNWSFPGGTPATSTDQNPTVVYNTPGVHDVTLTVTNPSGSDVLTQTGYITVASGTAMIVFTEDFNGSLGAFTSTVNTNGDDWFWGTTPNNFYGAGPANFTSAANGFAIIDSDSLGASVGGEDVDLTSSSFDCSLITGTVLTFESLYREYQASEVNISVSGDGGATWTVVLPDYYGSYVANQLSPNPDLVMVDISTIADGNSNVQIRFNYKGDWDYWWMVDDVVVSGCALPMAAPVADFSASETAGCAPFTTTFTDLSLNGPSSWSWSFTGPVSIPTSTSANPSVTFSAPGTYSVTLVSTNGIGSDTEVKNAFITVYDNPTANVTTTPSHCGQQDGTAMANASSGTGPYMYMWDNGASTDMVPGLSPGTYQVTVTDINGCETTSMGSLADVPAPTAVITSPIDPTCGGSNGSATVVITGGTAPVNPLWDNGSTATTATGLAGGPHSVTVTDQFGCQAVANINLANSSAIVMTVTSNDATCGNPNGIASAASTGGTGSYNYVWSNGETSQTNLNLAPGTYTVTVMDQSGCDDIQSVTVGNVPAPTVSISNSDDESCGNANGMATASASGAAGPFMYQWNTGATDQTIMGLTQGTYTVTATDMNGCQSITSVSLTNVDGPSAVILNTIDADCGQANGSATADVTLGTGTGPYNYFWNTSPVQSTQVAVGLNTGAYTVTVVDANGCESMAVANISNSNGPVASISGSTPSECAAPTGSATVNSTGGAGGNSYVWSTSPAQNSQTASNLAPGTYSVTVTDANGCSGNTSVTIDPTPSPVITNSSVTDGSCGDATGTIDIFASGGTGAYSYTWNPAVPNSGLSATDLPAGFYGITVTDQAGCTASTVEQVTNTVPPAVFISGFTNSICGANNGSATAGYTGGTLPITFEWSNNTSGQSISNLAPGDYFVTVTDAAFCTSVEMVTIADAGGPTAFISTEEAATCGDSNGMVEVAASGGQAPYQYQWSSSPSDIFPSVSDLGPGAYTVTITDVQGCTITATAVVDDEDSPSLMLDQSQDDLCEEGVGSIGVITNGGTPGYVYSWDNGATTSYISGLAGGMYSVTVVDDNGCMAMLTETIESTPPVTASATTGADASCGLDNGSVSVMVSGGSAPFSYNWNTIPAQTTVTASGLSGGNYSVIVTDEFGCEATASAMVADQPGPTVGINDAQDVTCFGAENGSASANGTGGTGNLSYNWSDGQMTQTASGLAPGTYTVTVTDENGCESTSSIDIVEPDELTLTLNPNEPTGGLDNGNVSANVVGGTTPYDFMWSDGQTAQTAVGLGYGMHSVTVTDANGCETTDEVEFLVGISKPSFDNLVSVFPNPATGIVNVSFELLQSRNVSISLFNKLGQEVMNNVKEEVRNDVVQLNLKDIAAGVYYIQITGEDFLVSKKLLVE